MRVYEPVEHCERCVFTEDNQECESHIVKSLHSEERQYEIQERTRVACMYVYVCTWIVQCRRTADEANTHCHLQTKRSASFHYMYSIYFRLHFGFGKV